MPIFSPCDEELPELDDASMRFMRKMQPFSALFVTGVSPPQGPINGGTQVMLCGVGFQNSNQDINQILVKFSDAFNSKSVPAQIVSGNRISFISPDFSAFSVALPHQVTVELSPNRGTHWTRNGVTFTLTPSRASIDALGYPTWGYGNRDMDEFRSAHTSNIYGGQTAVFYPSSKPPSLGVQPQATDSLSDPYHVDGQEAQTVATKGEPQWDLPEDLDVAEELRTQYGQEGSWADPFTFYRAHFLVKDTYRSKVLQNQMHFSNGDI